MVSELRDVGAGSTHGDLGNRYRHVRAFTTELASPLSAEDCAIQSMPDVSPTRWHLAHTTWFFETFFLAQTPNYQAFHPQFAYLYNSYYNTLGEQFPRAERGLLSRPGLDEVRAYREYVDQHMLEYLANNQLVTSELVHVLEVGLNHEQQHQELILTDIKHVLSCNPLMPVYRAETKSSAAPAPAETWTTIAGGLEEVGHDGNGFAYDNESPRHRVWLERLMIADSLVTCGEYLRFIQDNGYGRPELWLSLGWDTVRRQKWQAPMYWTNIDGRWHEFTLAGLQLVDENRPVCHVSYFEADAFARWSGARLPTEFEWEVASRVSSNTGNFADELIEQGRAIHPQSAGANTHPSARGPCHMLGDVWEWTSSPYIPYPNYQPPAGALGEYNGKFMCNQFVLRGGSCATPAGHIRNTYRNFFPPEARWQFSGIRLAKGAAS